MQSAPWRESISRLHKVTRLELPAIMFLIIVVLQIFEGVLLIDWLHFTDSHALSLSVPTYSPRLCLCKLFMISSAIIKKHYRCELGATLVHATVELETSTNVNQLLSLSLERSRNSDLNRYIAKAIILLFIAIISKRTRHFFLIWNSTSISEIVRRCSRSGSKSFGWYDAFHSISLKWCNDNHSGNQRAFLSNSGIEVSWSRCNAEILYRVEFCVICSEYDNHSGWK